MFTNEFGEDDPLGLALKGRARERRLTSSLSAFQPIGGPLVDPNWDAFQQALDEQGVNQLQGGASAPGSNQIRGFGNEAVNRGGFSQQPSNSLRGLRTAVRTPKKKSAVETEADAYYKNLYPGAEQF